MRIGVTTRFQNSYFSGAVPQIACAIARSFACAGHDVTLLYPKGEASWFIDALTHGTVAPPRKEFTNEVRFDSIIEVDWALTAQDRLQCANHIIHFVHKPPIFHDMESVCYNWNPTKRTFKNVSAIWTYDFYSEQDIKYLEFLSGVSVYTVPYVWDPDAIDTFLVENDIPAWSESAKKVEGIIPSGTPMSISWCARIVETNFSNTSHCVMPLNIVSVIRQRGDPIRFAVHNGDHTEKNDFFKSNIANNLLLPDISGNMLPRVRLPELRREKAFFLSHQRFRPIKTFLIDAMYMGIPMIHNCAYLKNLGAPYFYELNQIQQAVDAWKTMTSDYASDNGFFNPKAHAVRQTMLRSRFSPQSVSKAYNDVLHKPMTIAAPLTKPILGDPNVLRVAFCQMWDQFQPKHNFFMYLLSWIGKINKVNVVLDETNPNVVFFGPLSNGSESRYPGVPKVFFSGENCGPHKNTDVILNIGFNYDTSPNYIRMPLWVTEINWWGADVDKMVNPKPVSLKSAMSVDSSMLDKKSKFCAFVATNGSNQNRNAAFQILNQWRGVDAGGRLFCNLPSGPIPAGLGGGGGELAKIDFYKQYKFALTFENSSAAGYTTEKLFHAKVAGCVPIYWGDPFVDRDFDSRGYINANQVSSPQDLIDLVNKVASDPEEWRKMAAVPALSEYKKRWCQKTMEEVGKYIFKQIVSRSVSVSSEDWAQAELFGIQNESEKTVTPEAVQICSEAPRLEIREVSGKKIFVTATNAKFVESAVNVLQSIKTYEPDIEKIVYVWPDVSKEYIAALRYCGATDIRNLPTTIASETAWSDFWEPHHYAWKLWVQHNALKEAEDGACVLYLDAGVLITHSMDAIWKQIDTYGIFLLDDVDQLNQRWCHPTLCSNIQITKEELKGHQITAGLLGYKKGSPYCKIAEDALTIAKTQRDSIVGEKWRAYSDVCLGHRHDQSILSVLTLRAGAPRLPLRDFYCDVSMRAAKQRQIPLYVHRGHYREIVTFADGIDEAYIVNLDRRKDRMERFNTDHPTIKDRVYRWAATDGRALTLTPTLVQLFRSNDFGWKKSVMGCALSHMGLWEKLANDKIAKRYLILEDDVKFEDKWLVKWMTASKHIPDDADVIYLGGVLPPNKEALPHITEQVNPYFARVKKNNFFGAERRYFHFCNYSYLLTQSGAQKIMRLIIEKGIFTSGDHMIVNHGDELLNIYFTTPLLATCFQEDDPIYQKSEFNNFNRVDNFDSDLWNNTDHFTKENILEVIDQVQGTQGTQEIQEHQTNPTQTTQIDVSQVSQTAQTAQTNPTQVWNEFISHIALKKTSSIPESISSIFAIWREHSEDEFQKNINWFRIFEQLVLTRNDLIHECKQQIVSEIKSLPHNKEIWAKVLELLNPVSKQKIYHLPMINPSGIFETQWLNSVFPKQIEWTVMNTLGELVASENPTILIQNIPGINMADIYVIFDVLAEADKKVNVLHLSDEFGTDDLSFYKKSSVKNVIRNYWRPDLSQYGDKVCMIPLGFANDRCADTSEMASFTDREHIWAFAGSADRPGRIEALGALRTLNPHSEHTKHAWSNPNLLDGPEYTKSLQNAKFVPCFRGSRALESYRLYEAIEHGAIPIYVPSESSQTQDEYRELYDVHPFIGFPSWEKAVELLPLLAQQTDVMEKHRHMIEIWWAAKKQEIRQKISALFV